MLNSMSDLRCPDCGEKIREEMRYCPACGVDLEAPLAHNDPRIGALVNRHLNQAQRAYDRGDSRGALPECDLALEYDPTHAFAHNLRGLILDDLNRTSEAIPEYREALRLQPGLEQAAANLRDALADKPEAARRPAAGPRPRWPLTALLVTAGGAAALLAAALLVAGLIQMLGLAPKTTLTFVPDTGPGVPVTASDLEETARILTERAEALGYRLTAFRVSANHRITGEIHADINLQDLAARIGAIGLLEFVDFGKTPVPNGTLVRTDIDHRFLPEAQGARWHTVMTNNAIDTASLSQDQFDGYAVDFTLTQAGALQFADHTRSHLNTYLGVVLDKVVLSAPIIQSKIPGGQGAIVGDFTEESAAALAASMNTRPLPIPIRLDG